MDNSLGKSYIKFVKLNIKFCPICGKGNTY